MKLTLLVKMILNWLVVAVFRRAVSTEWSHEYKVTTLMLMRELKMHKNRMMMLINDDNYTKDQEIVSQDSGFSS